MRLLTIARRAANKGFYTIHDYYLTGYHINGAISITMSMPGSLQEESEFYRVAITIRDSYLASAGRAVESQ